MQKKDTEITEEPNEVEVNDEGAYGYEWSHLSNNRYVRNGNAKVKYTLDPETWDLFDNAALSFGYNLDDFIGLLENYVGLFNLHSGLMITKRDESEVRLLDFINELNIADAVGREEDIDKVLLRYKPINSYIESGMIINDELVERFIPNYERSKISLVFSLPALSDDIDILMLIYAFFKEKELNLPVFIKSLCYANFCVRNDLLTWDEVDTFTSMSSEKRVEILKRFWEMDNYKSSKWSPNITVQMMYFTSVGFNFLYLSRPSDEFKVKKKSPKENFSIRDPDGGLMFYTLPILCKRFNRNPSEMVKMIIVDSLIYYDVVNKDLILQPHWREYLKQLLELAGQK